MFQKNFRLLLSLLLLVCLQAAPLAPVARAANTAAITFTTPVATSFSTYVPANRQSAIVLQGSDAEATALTYAIAAGPSHGALSGLNTSTGAVVYTPVDAYTGADSFTYTVTSGGETSTTGTVTLTVTNQKTRIIDTLTNASGAARSGKVTFILTQSVASPAGLIPAGASVSATVNSAGTFDVSVFPSKSLSPQAYYQVYFSDSATLNRELLGIYEIPFSTSTVSLAPYKVLDTNLAARYTFASAAAVEALTTAVATATLTQLLAGGSLASLTVAGGITAASATISGTVTAASFSGSFSGNGAGLTGIGSGTGGVINTGSTTIGADSDANSVGIIDFQTRATSRLTIENNGAMKGEAIRDATGSINIKQFHAKCDGVTDDSAAFLAAINAAITSGNSKTIRIPASTAPCQITSTVTKAFGATYDLVFQGDGSGSVIRLATGASADAFVFTGGNSITFRDVSFVGTAGVQDVRYGFKFDQALKVSFQDCYFYGLAAAADLILANLSYLYVERSHFYGCAADGSLSYAVINNTNWSGGVFRDNQFFDQGALNTVSYTKGGVGNPLAWIAARTPKTTLREAIVGTSPGTLSTANSQGVFTVVGNHFDEGATYSTYLFPDVATSYIEHFKFTNNRTNVSQASGAGVYVHGTLAAEIEFNWFGYVYLLDIPGVILNGAGEVTLRRNTFGQRVTSVWVLTPSAATTSRLTLIDNEGITGGIFNQPGITVDVTQSGKRMVKTFAAGVSPTAVDLTPSFDLEVPNSLSLGGAATWIKGTGAPSGGCSSGSFYSRLDGGVGVPGWYVCENSAWVAK
jgi:hypothetical protein